MSDLISRAAAIEALRDVLVPKEDIGFGEELTDGYNDGVDMAITVVSGAPTVDAAPVRHGRWNVYFHTPKDFSYSCNQCGYSAPYGLYGGEYSQKKWDYCPNCGAKMEVEHGRPD